MRDSRLLHTLLRLDDEDAVLGHPAAGTSWEGFVLQTFIRTAPDRAQPSFYCTAKGVEVDLVLSCWQPALADRDQAGIRPQRSRRDCELPGGICGRTAHLLVHSRDEQDPVGRGIDAIGLVALAAALAARSRCRPHAVHDPTPLETTL